MAQSCRQCGVPFEVLPEDLKFLGKIAPEFQGKRFEIPSPTLCPDCRMQRRLSFRNEHNLYRRTCDATKKQIISIYSQEKSYPIYSPEYWWSEKWDALEYGQEFDFSRSFFEQFAELQHKVPRLALHVVNNEGADYVNMTGYSKNCYLVFAGDYNEDCLYGTQIIRCRNVLDAINTFESEHSYELIDSEKCFELFFGKNCSSVSNSLFVSSCKNANNCLFCVNQRNVEYMIWNKQISKEEFRLEKGKVLQRLNAGELEALWKEFLIFEQKNIHKAAEITNSENVLGDNISNSHNAFYAFNVDYGEDVRYIATAFQVKDLMDICHATEMELGYDSTSVGYKAYNILFTHGAWTSCSDILYGDMVHTSHHLFGCVGLRGKSYCIFNKQYTKEEYEKLVPKIIEHMQKTKEWGEFFPVTLSPFAYNETTAAEYYPLSQQQVVANGWKWQEPEQQNFEGVTKKIPVEKLPPNIADIPDDILQWAIECKESKRLFKIQKAELEFYRKMNLPVPQFHPDVRHAHRMTLRNPRKLWQRKCAKCGKAIYTTFAPERPEIIHCEECYLAAIY